MFFQEPPSYWIFSFSFRSIFHTQTTKNEPKTHFVRDHTHTHRKHWFAYNTLKKNGVRMRWLIENWLKKAVSGNSEFFNKTPRAHCWRQGKRIKSKRYVCIKLTDESAVFYGIMSPNVNDGVKVSKRIKMLLYHNEASQMAE